MTSLIDKVEVKDEFCRDISYEPGEFPTITLDRYLENLKSACFLPGCLSDSISWSFFVKDTDFYSIYLGCCVQIKEKPLCSYLLYSLYDDQFICYDSLLYPKLSPDKSKSSFVITFTLLPQENKLRLEINNTEYSLSIPTNYTITSVFPCVVGTKGQIQLTNYIYDPATSTSAFSKDIQGYASTIDLFDQYFLTPFHDFHFMQLPPTCHFIQNTKKLLIDKQAKDIVYLQEEFIHGVLSMTYNVLITTEAEEPDCHEQLNLTFGFATRDKKTILSYNLSKNEVVYNDMKMSIQPIVLPTNQLASITLYIDNIEQFASICYNQIPIHKFSISSSYYSYIPYVHYESPAVNIALQVASIATRGTIINLLPDWMQENYVSQSIQLPLRFHTNKENKDYIYIYNKQPQIYSKPKSSCLSLIPFGIESDMVYSNHKYSIEFECISTNTYPGSVGFVVNNYSLDQYYAFSYDGSLYHGQQMITKNKNRSFHSHDILRLEFVINYQYNDIADSFLCMDSEEEESNSINEDPTEMINENSNAESFLGGVDVTLFINGEEQPSAFHSMNGVLYPALYISNSQGFKFLSYTCSTSKNIHIYTEYPLAERVRQPLTFNKTLYNILDTSNDLIHSTVDHETYAYNIYNLESIGKFIYSYQVQATGEAYGLARLPSIQSLLPVMGLVKDYTAHSKDTIVYDPSRGELSVLGDIITTGLYKAQQGDTLQCYVDHELHLFTFYVNNKQICELYPIPSSLLHEPLTPAVYLPTKNTLFKPLLIEYLMPQSLHRDLLYMYNQNQCLNRLFDFYDALQQDRNKETQEWREIFKDTTLNDYINKASNGQGANNKVYQFQLSPERIQAKYPNMNNSSSFALKRLFTLAYVQPSIYQEFLNDYNIPLWTPSKYLPQSYYFLNDYIYDIAAIESQQNFSTINYSVVEYMYNTLLECIQKTSLSPETILLILLEISHGLNHIYHLSMSHRDIKLDNIMVTHPGFLEDIKLIDLGGCTDCLLYDIKKGTGNALHRAPELNVSESDPPGPLIVDHSTSDMWGLGILGFELYFGSEITNELLDFTKGIPDDILPETEDYNKLREFFQAVLIVDPTKRYTPPQTIALLQELIWDIPSSIERKFNKYFELATELDYNFLLTSRYTPPYYVTDSKEELLLDMIINAFRFHDYL